MCGSAEREDLILLCDLCDAGCHTYCATPPLKRIPAGEWFCDECTQDRSNKRRRGGGSAAASPAKLSAAQRTKAKQGAVKGQRLLRFMTAELAAAPTDEDRQHWLAALHRRQHFITGDVPLPASCEDLPLPPGLAIRVAAVYELMRAFPQRMELSHFLFEDMCAALNTGETTGLLTAIHLRLLMPLHPAMALAATR